MTTWPVSFAFFTVNRHKAIYWLQLWGRCKKLNVHLLHFCQTIFLHLTFRTNISIRDVRGGAFSSGAGRGWKSAGRSGAGRGEKARESTDLKIRQKCVNCYWRICITVWCFDQGKHYILWLLNGLSANQIITSCTKDQMNSFSFISFSSPFLAQMCGHNLCNLQSALPRCAPRVLSISAGRGGAGQGLLFAGRGGAGRASLVQIILHWDKTIASNWRVRSYRIFFRLVVEARVRMEEGSGRLFSGCPHSMLVWWLESRFP